MFSKHTRRFNGRSGSAQHGTRSRRGERNELMVPWGTAAPQGSGVPRAMLVLLWGSVSFPSLLSHWEWGWWERITVLQELGGQEVALVCLLPPVPMQDTGQAPGGALGAVGVLALARNSSRTGASASHAWPQHVSSSEGCCWDGSWCWCTCGTRSILLPQPRVQRGAPPIPPALTHRGGGQRLPPHQLPRPQPVEEVTELALGAQPRGGEDEPVWDGAECCHGPAARAGHAPDGPGDPSPPQTRCPRAGRALRAVGAVAVGAAVGGLAAALPGDPGPHLHRDAGLGAPPDVAAQLFGAALCEQRHGVSAGSRRWHTAAGGAWPEQPPRHCQQAAVPQRGQPGGIRFVFC